MRDNEKEDARKRGGAFTVPILSMWKNRGGGGRINDGGRSGGTLRYNTITCKTLHGPCVRPFLT